MYHRMAWLTLFNSRLAARLRLSFWLFPGVDEEGREFDRVNKIFSQQRFMEDHKRTPRRHDILTGMHTVTDRITGQPYPDDERLHKALLLIRAGYTTSSALSSIFFYLSCYPSSYVTLAHEIRSAFSSTESIIWGPQLSSCYYLRACLDEAMRLSPPAPGAFWREVYRGGVSIDGVQIPAGCEVAVGGYALHHTGQYYPGPYIFRPERFLPPNKKIIPDGAFAPFHIGPRMCPAKAFAYREMSLLVARVIWLMDFRAVNELGEGRPGLGWGREMREEHQMDDLFSAKKEGPVLQFRLRKGSAD